MKEIATLPTSLRGLRSRPWQSIPLSRYRRSFVLLGALIVFLLAQTGCEPPASQQPSKGRIDSHDISIYNYYVPAKVHILPLTEFVQPDNAEKPPEIKIYVSLLDKSDSEIKTPAVFRFELYEYVLQSAEPKGKRLTIWPDIDLTDPDRNNQCWRDFLRAYEFNLPFDLNNNETYVLEATCICPNGKRLLTNFELKPTK